MGEMPTIVALGFRALSLSALKIQEKAHKPDGFSSLKRLLADNLQHPIV
jgi:hypothetical protein